jgi:hypothetical protein
MIALNLVRGVEYFIYNFTVAKLHLKLEMKVIKCLALLTNKLTKVLKCYQNMC